jgi:hypothetical protein
MKIVRIIENRGDHFATIDAQGNQFLSKLHKKIKALVCTGMFVVIEDIDIKGINTEIVQVLMKKEIRELRKSGEFPFEEEREESEDEDFFVNRNRMYDSDDE